MLNKTLSLTVLLSLSSACGLIKVNGKPLGGGSSSAPSSPTSPTSSTSSTSSSSDTKPGEEEWAAEERRGVEEDQRQEAALRSGNPAWCKEYSISESEDIDLAKLKDLENPVYDESSNVMYFAKFLCSVRGKNRELKPKVLALRAKWMRAQGFDEQDFVTKLALNKGHGWGSQKYDSFAGPVSQLDTSQMIDLDRLGARASMLARVGFVKSCTDGRSRSESEKLLGGIVCSREPLDKAKAFAEIEATQGMNPETRFELRKLVRKTVRAHDALRAEIAAMAKEEPGIAQLVAIADAQHKEWSSPNPERSKLEAQLEAMEVATTANKRSGFAGCEAATYPAWVAQVKGATFAKLTFETADNVVLPAVFRTADAYLAFEALVLCARGSGVKAAIEAKNPAMLRRGPRTATIAAWMTARDSIKFDDKGYDGLVPRASFGWPGRILDGTIAKLVPDGDHVTISFKAELYKRNDCVESKKTGKYGFYTDGRPYAEEVCTKREMVTHDSSPQDKSVPAFWAKGLKPGMFLFVGEDDSFPIAALNAREGTGTWALGAPVK